MKQVMIQRGRVVLRDVPAPIAEAGTVLVAVNHSCISVGTEMNGVRSSGMPIWKRAMKEPAKIKRAMATVAEKGVFQTHDMVRRESIEARPSGYSAAGVVLSVGAGINDIQPGNRVACSGAQCAHHAEIIRVPRNLCVKIPGNLDTREASTVTLGAIALQGVRRGQPTLGEVFVVIGLGILGQLTVQILKANGCRVIGADLEPGRVAQALALGMDYKIAPGDFADERQVARLTGGIGADGVIITAASASHTIVSNAFRMCRKKGRVVLVGDVGLNLDRGDLYAKELDFFVSTSYGPGRYDENYEEKGLDYPIAYIRWTENRNMQAYLRLLDEGKIVIDPLIHAVYDIRDAPAAYESLNLRDPKTRLVFFRYPPANQQRKAPPELNPAVQQVRTARVRVALVGAGSFSRAVLLPGMKQLASLYHLKAIMSRTAHNAGSVKVQFGADYATTDFEAVLRDPDIDAVVIATRHDRHATMALDALRAGKHVFVEKPTCLDTAELNTLVSFFHSQSDAGGDPAGGPMLMTGYNRRFSGFARRIFKSVKNRIHPMVINYRVNAGYIPLDHWIHTREGGGRNIGEACHIYDLLTFLTGAKVTTVQVLPMISPDGYYGMSDNFITLLGFEDGSVATVTYASTGAKNCPKERLEVFVDGHALLLDDYKLLSIHDGQGKKIFKKETGKGYLPEFRAFANAIQKGGAWPIPLWQQIQVATISFQVQDQLSNCRHIS